MGFDADVVGFIGLPIMAGTFAFSTAPTETGTVLLASAGTPVERRILGDHSTRPDFQAKQMIDYERTIEIARPVEEVFGFVADQRNAPRWQPDLHEVRRAQRGTDRGGHRA